ncbi:hypothetical protein [Legionella sp.]|uniref:hypothetical protein n=1 Tax=Legionella sp. TaxID=459 RepID=UPI003CA5983F
MRHFVVSRLCQFNSYQFIFPLVAGDPLVQVKELQADAPDWNGLTSRQLMRLKSACEQRIKSCTRKNQNPLMK